VEEPADSTVSAAAKKPCVNGVSATGHETAVNNDDPADDKESLRSSTLIVRLPTQAPNAPHSSVIVIDDSDDDDPHEPDDVKPDRGQLDEQIAVEHADVDSVDRKPSLTDLPNVVEHAGPSGCCLPSESSQHGSQLDGHTADSGHSSSSNAADSVLSASGPSSISSASSPAQHHPRQITSSSSSSGGLARSALMCPRSGTSRPID